MKDQVPLNKADFSCRDYMESGYCLHRVACTTNVPLTLLFLQCQHLYVGIQWSNCLKHELLVKLHVFPQDIRHRPYVQKYEQAIFQPALTAGQIEHFLFLLSIRAPKRQQSQINSPSQMTFTLPHMYAG